MRKFPKIIAVRGHRRAVQHSETSFAVYRMRKSQISEEILASTDTREEALRIFNEGSGLPRMGLSELD